MMGVLACSAAKISGRGKGEGDAESTSSTREGVEYKSIVWPLIHVI